MAPDGLIISSKLAEMLHLEVGETASAFQFVEQAKSRGLAEGILRSPPSSRLSGSPEDEAVERPRRRLRRL